MLTNIVVYVDLEGSSYIYTGSNAVISDYENEARTITYTNLDDYSTYTKKVVIKNSRRETYTATLDNNNSFKLVDGHLSEGKLLLQLYLYSGDTYIRDNTIIKLDVMGSLNNSTEIEAGTTLAIEVQAHIDDADIHFSDAPEDDTIYGRINGEWAIVGGSGGSNVWGSITGTLSNQTDLQTALNAKASTSHTHTEYASITHNHDTDYADISHNHTESDITDLQSYALSNHNHDLDYADINHTHDDRYYTETETNALLSGKSDTTHNHDSSYYTETEVDTLLLGKSDTSHTHTDLHTHANKALLDTYDQTNTDITTAITNSHTHTNKAVLDDIIDSGDGNSFLANDGTYKAVSSGSASWGTITGTLSSQTDLQTALNSKASTTHTHVEADITDLQNYSLSTHNHDLDYADIAHNHDDRYYTETEVNTLLSGYSQTTHNHDLNYANITHTHVESDITDLGTYLTDAPSDSNTYGRNNGSWVQVSGTGAVDSVNGQTGVVVLDADDIDDTSTTNKFISQAELTKLVGIETGAQVNDVTSVNSQTGVVVLDSDDVSEGTTNLYMTATQETNFGTAYTHSQTITGNPHSVTKSDVGLGNVDNTSDADKPISTATQTALNGKSDTTHNHDLDYADISHNHDSLYYTETEVDTLLSGKSDTTHTHTDLHTHTNKTLLDTYNQTNADITTAITNSHTHTNKSTLDNIISSGDGNSFLANDGTYKAVSSGSASWGGITGTLSNQTDLQTALNNKSDTTHTHDYNDLNTQPMQKTLLYYGYPTSINEVWSVEGAVSVYANYDVIIFGDGYQESTHEENQNMIDVITQLKALKPNIQIFGYIPIGLGVSGANLTMTVLKERADDWLACGATGVLLDEFGYDYSVTRDRQNEIVVYAHGLGLNVIANSWTLDHAFSKQNIIIDWLSNFNGNPNLLESELNENDYYLFEHLFWQIVSGNQLNGTNNWKIYEAVRYNQDVDQGGYTTGETYRQIFGTQLMVLDAIGDARTDKESLFLQSYIGSHIINIDAYCASVSDWGASNTNYIHYKFDFVDLKENTRHTTVMGDYNGTYKKFTATINGITFDLYWDRAADVAITNGTSRIDQDGVTRTHLFMSADELYITKVEPLTNGSNADTLHKHAQVTDSNASTGAGQLKLYTCTQAEYDAIGTKDSATLYIIA